MRTSYSGLSTLGVIMIACVCRAHVSRAQSIQCTTPHLERNHAPIVSTLGKTQFTNYGLVAVGRIPASCIDSQGSTFGSVSAIAVRPGSWAYDVNSGVFSGEFLTLPDRGRNDPKEHRFADYQSRVQRVAFEFRKTNAENEREEMRLTYKDSLLFNDEGGRPLVGADPGDETRELFSATVPSRSGNITIDAEGLVVLPSGDLLVSDEYAAGIYRFSPSGALKGFTMPPEALYPRTSDGVPKFTSSSPPATGRRPNQGFEGLSMSPSGHLLFAMAQSATMQDCDEKDHSTRRFTRLFAYGADGESTTLREVGHYIVELPTYQAHGNGKHVDQTATASEVLAISDRQLLVLTHDSNGRGSSHDQPIVFKSILLVDLDDATNLAQTEFNGVKPIALRGVLADGIKPAKSIEVVNLLNPDELARFGLNLDVSKSRPDGDRNTLSEKWEALALASDTSTDDPNDFLLFVANDNDFIATKGVMKSPSGEVNEYADQIDVDTLILTYRVRIAPSSAATTAPAPETTDAQD